MTFTKPNRSPATFTRNRVEPAPISGICVTCLDGCPGPCEVGRSALRGREILYPQPFSKVTAEAEKDYSIDYSHFNIQGTCAMAGRFSLEDHIFKAIALAAPYIKTICLGRASMSAAMVGNTIGEMVKKGKIPADVAKFGTDVEHVFILAAKLKDKYGKDFERIPTGTIGMITYFDRLNAGLQQLMAGARKFALKYISRNDLCALTRKAAEMSGIPYVMDSDQEEVNKILG